MKPLVESLRALGFGTDRDIDGAEVINTLNDHWPALLAQAGAEAAPEHPQEPLTITRLTTCRAALRRLLACPDLNLDSLEPETRAAIQQAEDELSAAQPTPQRATTAHPPAIVKLLHQQNANTRELLEIIPDPAREGCWTLALKRDHTVVLKSRIETVEAADLYLAVTGRWREGKPGVDESFTTYHVGGLELWTDEDFDPVRYT